MSPAVVQSLGEIVAVGERWAPTQSYASVRLYDRVNYAYATLYRTQPNVRTCVDFMARNIAQLGLHVFRRVSDTDRVRLRDHPLAKLLARPTPWDTTYRLIEALMGDLGVYFNAYWLKIRGPALQLLRIPPAYVQVKGALGPSAYIVDLHGWRREFGPEDIVHFRGYNAESAVLGLSPLETLRRILAEEHAMGQYREGFWRNSARMYGVIERPATAPEWSEAARERFRAQFEELYSGAESSGKTAVLEEGMTWRPVTFTAQESEYLGARKLTREECARAYHIPLPMVGILDHATFSNIREQHKHLYQDSLGPWLTMIEQEIQAQLLPEFTDTEGVYCEFNIAEKLQGSFEEQAQSFQSSVGRPWMTPNEARARLNLPQIEGGDGLALPLNVLIGGQASPLDSGTQNVASVGAEGKKARRGQIDPTQPALRERYREQWRRLMAGHFRRQQEAIVGKITSDTASVGRKVSADEIYDMRRWNRELTTDMYRLGVTTASAWARYVAEQLAFEDLDEDRMLPWIEETSRIAAEEINATTRDALAQALTEEKPRESVLNLFALAVAVRAAQIATSRVTTLSSFGSQEAARQGGLRTKTWQVNSSNPRDSHAALDGETVGIEELFSNGMRWPGDPAGGADENANCQCSVTFGRGR